MAVTEIIHSNKFRKGAGKTPESPAAATARGLKATYKAQQEVARQFEPTKGNIDRTRRTSGARRAVFAGLAALTGVAGVNHFAGEGENYQPTAEQQAVVAHAQAVEDAKDAPDSYLSPKDTWVTLTAEKPLVQWGIAQDAIPETDDPNDGNQRAELANALIEETRKDGTPAVEVGEQFSVPPEVVDNIDPTTIKER